ncbi:MAG: hypothetical protein CMP59_12465 [Flavobacteriales bacterium]|nr:hypothetical protein [Flavobacteriales bacterium]
MIESTQIFHKIRGSYPGFIGIELPTDYEVLLMDEDNFNAYRKGESYQALYPQVKHQYCHFEKPVDGSWTIVVKANSDYFDARRINIIYKSAENPQRLSTTSSNPIWPTASTTHPAASMP